MVLLCAVWHLEGIEAGEFSSEAQYKKWVEEEAKRRSATKDARRQREVHAKNSQEVRRQTRRAALEDDQSKRGLTEGQVAAFYDKHNKALSKRAGVLLSELGEVSLLTRLYKKYGEVPEMHLHVQKRWEESKQRNRVQTDLARVKSRRESEERRRHDEGGAGLQQALRENPHFREAMHREEAERQWIEEESQRTRERKVKEKRERERAHQENRERQERKRQAIAEQEWRDVEQASAGRIKRRRLTEESLRKFYEKHNKKRIGSVRALLESYDDEQLLQKLHDQYGTTPIGKLRREL
jgi:hypothetical protein